MLDPLSAIGLASSVVQFVDFASKLISKGNEYHRSASGALVEHDEFRLAASRLKRLSDGLDVSLNLLQASAALSPEEEALKSVVADCRNMSIDLTKALKKLQYSGAPTMWKSFRQALKSVWGKEGIETRLQKLRDAQNLLTVHLLVVMSQDADKGFSEVMKRNDNMEDTILKAIRTLHTDVKREIAQLSKALSKSVGQERPRIIETWRNTRQDELSHILIEANKVNDEQKRQEIEGKLLSTLYFLQIEDRHERIAEAHAETFGWIFDQHPNDLSPGAGMVKWLREPGTTGIYWISGKAGSGKSTLMRYLSDQTRTANYLKYWARGRKLLKASCFFWNPGTPMQKSLKGLLQSLMYELFSEAPEFISTICPWRYRQYALGKATLDPWTDLELRNALEAFIENTRTSHKICLFIDGLDEFDGTDEARTNMLQFFIKFSKSSHVKMCLSSRPWLIFKDAFDDGPHLQLEDLTRNDIRKYVRTELEEHPRFRQLRLLEPEQTSTIIIEITEKAKGVFLWVLLVVRSLREGLRNEDRCADLLRRLKLIPSDLEEFFKLIVKSIDPFYFTQACQMFLMVLKSDMDLSLPTLFFASEDDWAGCATSIRDMPSQSLVDRLLSMKRRLNVLCKGLLEVYERKSPNVIFRFSVDFLHRTVRDFLMLPEMQTMLANGVPLQFEARYRLCQGYLAQIMLLETDRGTATGLNLESNLGDLIKLTDLFLVQAVAIEQSSLKTPRGLLEVLGYMLDSITSRTDWVTYTSSHIDYPRDLQCCGVEFWINWNLWENSFLSLTIIAGLDLFVIEHLRSHPDSAASKKGRPLLDYALRPGFEGSSIRPFRKPPRVDLAKAILKQGANPNKQYGQATVWGLFLEALHKPDRSKEVSVEWLQATELLVTFDASMEAPVSHEKFLRARRYREDGYLSDSLEEPSGVACISEKACLKAFDVISVFPPADTERLRRKLRERHGISCDIQAHRKRPHSGQAQETFSKEKRRHQDGVESPTKKITLCRSAN